MTGMTEAMPRSPEEWKSMGCCVDFPQPSMPSNVRNMRPP